VGFTCEDHRIAEKSMLKEKTLAFEYTKMYVPTLKLPCTEMTLLNSGESMSLLIGDNLVVSMHYKLTDDEGIVLDSSEGAEPLTYLHGAGNIIPGLEKALVGKVEGDTGQVKVEPEEGYGEVMSELIQIVEKAAFQGVESVEVGMSFEAQAADGSVQHIVVKSIEGEEVTIDANHPLAGVTLNFDIEIVSVREATEEEISHGHVH
jgi:FKBP-type peptidyl-prolyl cis-trans isomerase SlyD